MIRSHLEATPGLSEALFTEGETSLSLLTSLAMRIDADLEIALLAAIAGGSETTLYRNLGQLVMLMRQLRHQLQVTELPSPIEIDVHELAKMPATTGQKRKTIGFSVKGLAGLQVSLEAYYSNGQKVKSLHGTSFTLGKEGEGKQPSWLKMCDTQAEITFASRSQDQAVTVIVTTSYGTLLHHVQALNWEFNPSDDGSLGDDIAKTTALSTLSTVWEKVER